MTKPRAEAAVVHAEAGPRKLELGLDQPWFIATVLCLVLLKLSGIRIWPHGYAGQVAAVPRLLYYAEFAVSLLALAALLSNAARVDWRRPWIALSAVFMTFAVASAAAVGQASFATLLTALGYWDGFAAVVLASAILQPRRCQRLLTVAAVFFIGLNLAAVVVPSTSFMIGEFAGKYRGLTAHRNDLAQITTVAAFCLLCFGRQIGPKLRLSALLGAVLLIGMAASVQGILLMLAGIFIYVGIRNAWLLRHPMVGVSAVFVVGLGVIAWWTFGSLDEFLRLFGRDSSFTGRDRIWRLALYLLGNMPWYGYGFGAFSSQIISPVLLESFQLGTLFGTAHNSYLEALLAYGWLGGGCFFLAVMAGAVAVITALRHAVGPQSTFAAMILMTCLVGGFTASEKLFLPQFGWLSFILACAMADASRRETP